MADVVASSFGTQTTGHGGFKIYFESACAGYSIERIFDLQKRIFPPRPKLCQPVTREFDCKTKRFLTDKRISKF